MNYLKKLSLAVVAATALAAMVGAGSVSATTLEVGGVGKNESVSITATLNAFTSMKFKSTSGEPFSTCLESQIPVSMQPPYTEKGAISGFVYNLWFGKCSDTTDALASGNISFSHIAGTTNATVTSSGAEVLVRSTSFGVNYTCSTGGGTDIGTLTGVSKGVATLDLKAILSCGIFMPSAVWEGTYDVTTPFGLGVIA